MISHGPVKNAPLALFVGKHFIVGGVETLMSRLSRHLASSGWRVAILTTEANPASRRLVPEGVTLYELKEGFQRLFNHGDAVRTVRSLGLNEVQFVFTGDPVGSWAATILSSALPEHPKVLCGVYQQEEYFYPPQREFFRSTFGIQLRARNFDRTLADSSKLFTCERVREVHAENFGRSLDDSPILILPVDSSMFAGCQRRPDRFRIISVGRVTAWKTYNHYMIPVVRRLVDKGYPVHWDVYGDGEILEELERQIEAQNLSGHISLKRTLDYSRMSNVMENAGVFVGMGTSMLEAAFCRVPCVPAVARETEPLTYGCIWDFPLGCVGEQLAHRPTTTVESLIERVLQMSESEYSEEMTRTWESVQPYELQNVCSRFVTLIEKAKPATLSRATALAYRLHSQYLNWRVMKSTP